MQKHRKWSSVLGFAFLFLCVAGCSPQTKDKWLRTFIDGVPSLEKEEVAVKEKDGKEGKKEEKKETKALPEAPKPALFSHPPFLEKQCDSCHESKFSQKLTAKGKELCFTCHDDFTQDKVSVHYPASEGECTECHDPHQSPNQFMLKKSVPQLCFNCHDEKDIKAHPAHEGQESCLECHTPHASKEEKLLK